MANPALSEEKMREAVEAVQAHGSINRAAHALGLARSTLQDRIKHAARQGIAPGHWESGTAPGFAIGKVTIQRGPNGQVERTWERQSPEQEAMQQAMDAAVRAMCQDISRAAPIPAPTAALADLLALYTLTDGHVGMKAWHREGGQDWDLTIAEDTIVGCFAEAIKQSPAAQTAIFNQLGDLLHYDGLSAVTPTSGHILDADGRFTKMVEMAVRIIRRIIALMLAKHQHVHVIMAEGNHDMASSVWLRTMMKALYENEPRITVDDSALPYYVYEFGETFLGFHHSHVRKMEQLPSVMAAQFPKEWGRTTKRYCHTGDKHHSAEKDSMGITVIQHPTLAARDAYAARGGWFSERFMQAMIFHRRFGMVGRVVVCPEMLEAA
jgi:hypothetical protein